MSHSLCDSYPEELEYLYEIGSTGMPAAYKYIAEHPGLYRRKKKLQ
jgi:hypothetical protein